MTEEQIKQNALEYSGCSESWFNDVSYIGESTAYDDAHAFYDGAHSRDEEVEQLRKALSSAQQAMAELAQMARNPWISVKDEKPAEDKDVIFMLPDGLVYRGFRKVIGIRDIVFLCGVPKGTNCYMISDVSHWMSIPELKKGE